MSHPDVTMPMTEAAALVRPPVLPAVDARCLKCWKFKLI